MRMRFLVSMCLAALIVCGWGCRGQQAQDVGENDPSAAAAGVDSGAEQESGTQPDDGDAPETTPSEFVQATEGADLGEPAAKGAGGIDTSYIAEDFVAAAVVHPRQILQSKLLAKVYKLPQALLQGLERTEVGFVFDADNPQRQTAESLDEAIVLLAPADAPPHLALAFIFHCHDAQAANAMVAEFKENAEKRTHNGTSYYFKDRNVREWRRVEVPTEQAEAKIAELKQQHAETRPRGSDEWLKLEFVSTKNDDGKTTTIVARTIRQPSFMDLNVVWQPDAKTIVGSKEPLLNKMIDSTDVKSPLIERLTALSGKHDLAVVAITEKLRPAIELDKKSGSGPISPLAQAITTVLDSLAVATITGGLDADRMLKVELEANDEAGAQTINQQVNAMLQMGQGLYGKQAAAVVKQQPGLQPLVDVAGRFVDGVAVKQDGTAVVVTVPALQGLDELPALLKPMADAAERKNRIWSIALSILNHSDQRGDLPRNLPYEGGTPLLSWRVALLPYWEKIYLYRQFKLDESWDSEHNRQFLEQMPVVLAPVEGDAKPGHSVYLMFQGEGTLLDGKPKKFRDLVDGASDTIAVIEVSPERAVPWTKPIDIDFTAADLKQTLGPPPTKEGYPVAYFDGRVDVIPPTIDMEEFRRMIRLNDSAGAN